MSLKEFDSSSNAAIADEAAAPARIVTFDNIPLDLIVTSHTNPRRTFDDVKLAELVESVRFAGVVQPILVRPIPHQRLADTAFATDASQLLLDKWEHKPRKLPRPVYEIIAGERRYRASILAGTHTIPAMIRAMDDQHVLELQLVENLQRDDLHPLEEAEGYQRLCDATGIKKEEIGAKIGKSRAYVYQRLHLLKLGNEAREAFRAGKLETTKATLLASVADTKLQLKALKEVTAENWSGRTMSFREFSLWLEQNVMLKLDHAPFDIKDATLDEAAGACGTCPQRTGVDRDIFAAFDSPDMCTNAKCYGNKATVSLARVKEAAAAKGMKVIAGVEAKKLKPNSYSSQIAGYTRLDEKIEGGGTVAKALGKDAPVPTIFVDPHTHEQIKVIPSEVVGDLLKTKGVQAASVQRTDSMKEHEAAQRKAKLDRQIEDTWRAKAALQIVNQVRAGAVKALGAPILRLVLQQMLQIMRDSYEFAEQAEALLPLWGLPPCGENDDPSEPVCRHVQAAPDEELGPMLFGLLLSDEVSNQYRAEKKTPVITQLAAEAGVDAEAIAREVKAEIKAAEKAKARTKEPAPPGAKVKAAPQGSVAREGSGKAAAKKPPAGGRKRLSAEEAQLGIADAMQELSEPADAGTHEAWLLTLVDADTVEKLLMVGITSVSALADMHVDELAALMGETTQEAERVIAAAKA
jgi:ParB/RepB/Spo0J family partition protein